MWCRAPYVVRANIIIMSVALPVPGWKLRALVKRFETMPKIDTMLKLLSCIQIPWGKLWCMLISLDGRIAMQMIDPWAS